MLTWRTERQATALALIVFILLSITGWIAYWTYPASTCFDNRKNQQETEIYCGGSCVPCELKNPKPINLLWARIVPVRPDVYDVAAEIKNPNEVLGASTVDYEFTLFDNFGVIARKVGQTFLFPQERIHVIETGLRTTRKPIRVEFRVLKEHWLLVQGEKIPHIVVERRDYRVVRDGERKKGVVEASILNKTSFDYHEVLVNFVVRDAKDNALAVNRVLLENLNANSRKTVTSIWPEELKGEVTKVDVEPRVNTFEMDTTKRMR